ncbi:MAG: hypothetical protein GY867_06735 [bacterium]|nr:hypothetical protein [bacterium]
MGQRVIVDNAIVRTVLSLLGPTSPEPDSSEWRVGRDSLLALVEAIVLSDQIYVDELDRTWAFASQGGDTASALHDIVHGIPVETTNRQHMRSTALEAVRKWFPTIDDLQRYLIATPCEESTWWELARDRQESESLHEELSGLYEQPLGHAGSPLYDVGFAAYRVAFYHLLCSQENHDYWPHPLRTGLLAPLLGDSNPNSFQKRTIKKVKTIRDKKALRVNEELDGTYDVDVPLILAAVLKKCHHKDQIIEQAMKMRAASWAADFRDWVEEVDKVLQGGSQGQLPSTAMDTIDGLCKELGSISPEKLSKRLSVSIGFPWGFSFSEGVKLRAPHLIFLTRIYDESWDGGDTNVRLRELLTK